MFRGVCRDGRGEEEEERKGDDDEGVAEEVDEVEVVEEVAVEERAGGRERGRGREGENSARGREPNGSSISVETSGMDKLRSDCPRG